MRQSKKTRARAFRRDSFFETLENRTLLSGTVTVTLIAGTSMTITGDSADNSVIIQDNGIGLFDITGTNGTSVKFGVTTNPAGVATAISGSGADKDLIINMGQGGNDSVDAANSIVLTDAGGLHYSLTYTGSTGNDSLFQSVAASGMVAFLNAPNAIQEVQHLTLDAPSSAGNYTLTVGTQTTGSLAYDASTTTIASALDTMLSVPKEVQVLTLNHAATLGTYTITAGSFTTPSLNWDDSAATIATAMDTLLSVSGTQVVGTMNGGTTLTFTFPNAAADVPLMTIDVAGLTTTTAASFAPSIDGVAGTVVTGTVDAGGTVSFTFPSMVGNLPTMSIDIAGLTGPTTGTFSTITDGAAVGTRAFGQLVLTDTPGTPAKGSIRFVAQAVAGDRVTISDGAGNVRTYTAVTTAPVAGQFRIGADKYDTAVNLAAAINNTTPLLAVTAVATGTQEIQTLTPTGSTTLGTFTVTYGAGTSAAIAHNAPAATVQTALRLVAGLSGVVVAGGPFSTGAAFTVTFPVSMGNATPLSVDSSGLTGGTINIAEQTPGVAPVGTSEVQTLNGIATAGTYTLSYGGNTTTAIPFGATTGTVQTALRLLSGLSAVVVGGGALSAGGMTFTFPNTAGDVSMITLGASTLTPAIGYTWVETTKGIAPESCTLTNDANGATGNQSIVVSTFSRPRMTAVGMTGGGITNVVAGNTVTLNDGVHTPVVFTFGTNPTDVAVGATAADSADNLIAAINAIGGSLLITASTTTYDGTIILDQDAAGLAGNTSIGKLGAQIAKTNFRAGTNGTSVQNGDQIVVNDGMNPAVTFTARRSAPDATLNEFLIGGDDIASIANFVALVNVTAHLDVTAVDNFDGSCTLTNDVAGVFGNASGGSGSLTAAGSGVAAVDMSGGAGYSIACLNLTATMNTGTNIMGIGAGGSGQSYIYNDVNYTGGANNDSVAIMGAFVGGKLTVALAAGDTTTGDSLVMGDDGTVPSFVAGDVSITQTAGLSTITLRNKATLTTPLIFGSKLTIEPGLSAGGAQVTTLNNVTVDGAFTYGASANNDADTLNFTGNVDMGDAVTVNQGGGANQWNTVATQEVQTLTPNAAATAGTFTFTYAGKTTAAINYNATLLQVQDALRLLPGCEGVVVTGEKLVGIDEVQTLTPAAVASAGTYTLTYGADTTANIAYDADAATVQAELRRFTAMKDIVVGGLALNLGAMTFTFPNAGNVNMITIDSTLATPATGYNFAATTPGGVKGNMIFTFPGGAGDASLLTAALGGLTGTTNGGSTLVETTKGSNFTFGGITGGIVTYTGTGGTDDVTLGGRVLFGAAATFNLGDATNTLTIGSATADGAFAVNGGTGADTISLGATTGFFARGTVTVAPLAGTNGLTLDNADVNGFTYTGGAGDDTLTIGTTSFVDTGAFSATVGDGINSLTMPNAIITGAVAFTGGTGNDTVTIGAKSFAARSTVNLNMGTAGVNAATINGGSMGVTYTGGSVADTLTMGNIAGRAYSMDGTLAVTGGAGANQLDYDGSLRGLTYTGGIDGDIVNLGIGAAAKFLCTGSVSVDAATGANFLTIKNANIRGATAGVGLTYIGGALVDTINIGQGGAAGVTVLKGTDIKLAAGDDVVHIDNSVFNATSGSFSLNSGLGNDVLTFDGAGSGTIFNRAVSICAGGPTTPFIVGGGNDLFADALTTKYLGRTALTKVIFLGFNGAGGTINGVAGGPVLGTKLITPTYT